MKSTLIMKKICFILFTIGITMVSIGQELTGSDLLEKAIAYHDPQNNWSSFNGAFKVTMATPNMGNRETEIIIDLPKEFFYSKAIRDKIVIEFTVNKDTCDIKFNGSKEYSEETAKEHRLNCERATMYKNYYTFLYGLPMKLKDPGTIIHEKVETKEFKGKDYLVLKASYLEEVGNDVWYFYLDPNSYTMEIYQFFHNEADNDGEYILLSEEDLIQGIKMPKIRAWYMNKDGKYLGTDYLKGD